MNEIKASKEKRTRLIVMLCVSVVLALIFIGYLVGICIVMGQFGVVQLIPPLLITVTSVAVFVFTFFKAANVIFDPKMVELQMYLPVKKTAIILSRFLYLYITNLVISIVVMLTGSIVYGTYRKPSLSFYVYGFLGTLFLALLPITLSVFINTIITAISVRMKHKSIVAAGLSVVFIVALFGVSLLAADMEQMNMNELVANLDTILQRYIGKIYPPAFWLGDAMVSGEFTKFLLFLLLSILIFVLLLAILRKYFLDICNAFSVGVGKKEYTFKRLKSSSIQKALLKKEIRRYVSSSIYVTNTMTGYVIMIIIPVMILVIGKARLEEMINLPGFIMKVIPFVLVMFPTMMPTTPVSISLEGSRWWILQTIPVTNKDIMETKVLTNLIVVSPFYLIAEIISFIALKPSLMQGIALLVVPLAYLIFGAVVGIFINTKFCVFDWENEVTVVKQSASTFFAMLIGFVSICVPVVVLILCSALPVFLIMIAVVVILLLITAVLWLNVINEKKKF